MISNHVILYYIIASIDKIFKILQKFKINIPNLEECKKQQRAFYLASSAIY